MTEDTTGVTLQARGMRRPFTSPAQLIVAAVGTGAALVVLGLLLRMNPIDLPLVQLLNGLCVGPWGSIAAGVYAALEPVYAILIALAIAAIVWAVSRRWEAAASFLGVVAVTWVPVIILKLIVMRPRPVQGVLPHPHDVLPGDPSFPSGHTAFVTAVVVALWFLVRDHPRGMIAAAVVGPLAVTAIAAVVTTLGLHYPTDVLASLVWVAAMAPTARWLVAGVIVPRLARVLVRRASPVDSLRRARS